ncbi:peroxisomal assembly protein [Ancistrocladus abbreviatus]
MWRMKKGVEGGDPDRVETWAVCGVWWHCYGDGYVAQEFKALPVSPLCFNGHCCAAPLLTLAAAYPHRRTEAEQSACLPSNYRLPTTKASESPVPSFELMVERRKPLVLASTKALVNSYLSSSSTRLYNQANGSSSQSADLPSCSNLELRAGILRISGEKKKISLPGIASLDDSALVGLSTSSLKRLSITSGSLILVKNVETNMQRIAQAIVLDPPVAREKCLDDEASSTNAPHVMLVFPFYSLSQNCDPPFNLSVAYLSPLLAFNIGLHTSCLTSLLSHGKETLASLFDVQECKETSGIENMDCAVNVRLEARCHLSHYASHLRVSFVKIPECGTIETLKGKSSIEAKGRQEMIDSALHDYFSIDRYLAVGDVFSIQINWNCNSFMCVHCAHRRQKTSADAIYFKVTAMDPLEEQILCVNRTQTALVLGASVASAVPPDPLTAGPSGIAPVHGETVKILASLLVPPLCPSVLSSKFKVSILLHGPAGSGKRTVVKYVAGRLGLHVVEYSCHNLMAASEKKASAALAQAFSTAHRYLPTIILLRHFDVFRNLASNDGSQVEQVGIASEVASVIREFTEPHTVNGEILTEGTINEIPHLKDTENISKHQVLLIASADGTEGLPPNIRRCFSHEIRMGSLTEEQRAKMLSQLLQSFSSVSSNDGVESFLKNNELEGSHGPKLVQHKPVENAPQILCEEHLTKALERSKKRNAAALGTPKVPNVKWEDVGGLEDVKKSILETVQLPLLHKNLFSSGLRKRSGVLLYGPPGTGKTLLAKAVATECSLNFLSVKGPELINMYIGESEKNVRDIFQKARSARPCVIFFDELDSLAPARGASGDSGGVMDRVVSQMLAEIDGLNDSSQDLFVIGASNRPDLIDPALLRPGRFDKLLFVGVNSDPSYRERVLTALTRKFELHEDVSLYSVAKRCPPNFTGADMYALCADAWFHAAKRKVLSSQSGPAGLPPTDDQADSVVVEYNDFVKVLGELSPSLSLAELRKYEILRDQFEGGSR